MTEQFESRIIVTRITDYGRKPTTEQQALRQARALLAEEGQWCQHDFFRDGDADDVFDSGAVCGSWSACAMGAIGLVTGDMPVRVRREPGEAAWWDIDAMGDRVNDETTLTYRAARYLAAAIVLESGDGQFYGGYQALNDPVAVVVELNDDHSTDRDRVLRFFDRAITLTRRRTPLEQILEPDAVA